MEKINKLQYLLELLDDDTSEVRNQIIKELRNYGPNLEFDIEEYSNILTQEHLKLLQPVIEFNRRIWLKENWSEWFYLDGENEKLEKALGLISGFHYGVYSTTEFSNLLDELSEEFILKIPYGDELDLAHFLFQEKGMKGAKEDYYNPFNSNPIYAIKEKKGLPITLAIIYILAGYRLGFDIRGCNFPGHFLAKFESDGETILVDCYNDGKFFYETDFKKAIVESKTSAFKIEIIEANSTTIIKRVLNNLSNSYSIIMNSENRILFKELSNQIPF